MQLDPKLFGTRELTQQFYIFYDKETGQTLHILRQPTKEQLTDDHITVAIDNDLVTAVMQGNLSIGQLIVAFDKDSNKRSLFKKDQYLRKVHEENSTLLKIDAVKEVDPITQLVVALYDQGLLEVSVNKSSLDNFISIVDNKNEAYQGYDHLNFYFVNATDPAKLYSKLVIDTNELINQGRIKINAPWYNAKISKKVITLTKRVFSTYQTVKRKEYIDTPNIHEDMSMQYLSDVTSSNDCHISFDIKADTVEVKSFIIDPMKYNIFDEIQLHAVKKSDPSQYIRTIKLTADQLKNNGTVVLEKVLDDSMVLIHDNPMIKVNLRKLNESTNNRI